MRTSGCLEIKGTVVTKCRDEDIRHVKIPEGVTSIGESAFYDCRSLTSVTIPEGVTSIGDKAFQCCSSLTSVVIPEGVTSIGDFAFDDCKSLTSVTIPEGVTEIGENAFYYCESLTSVTIPEGVTSIKDNAFDGCNRLASVTIPESVKSIGMYAFREYKNLTIYYAGSAADWKKVRQVEGAFEPGTKIQYNWQGPAPGDVARERPPKKQAAQPGTAKPTMRCPSCEAEWKPGKSAGSMAACPFCGASLADKDEQPDTGTIQGVMRTLILERGAELYKKESTHQLKALLDDMAAGFPRELKVLNHVIQEGVQERLLKADDGTDEEKREAATWCRKYLTEYAGMADERVAEAVNILAAGLGWKPPL